VAARLARDGIRKVACVEYPELGMAAGRRSEVGDFPAFIVVDDKGNEFSRSCGWGDGGDAWGKGYQKIRARPCPQVVMLFNV